jgi:hypothetical protein
MKLCDGWRFVAVLCAIVVSFNTSWVSAQTTGLQDASPYRGKPVADPEGLSGLWETSNGHGGFLGIHMVLGTSVAPDAKPHGGTLDGVEQRWEYLNLGVYEQRRSEFAFGDEGYFSDASSDAAVRINDGHLQLHYASHATVTSAVDLDLVKQGDRWVGRFHRGSFDQQVTLERPGTGLKTYNKVAGTWGAVGFLSRVVHVGEQAPGQFAGWTDALQIPGTVRSGPSVPPHRLFEIYGERVRVQRAGDAGVMFEFGADSAVCCARTWAGKLSVDGNSIESGSGPSAAGPFTKFVRVR